MEAFSVVRKLLEQHKQQQGELTKLLAEQRQQEQQQPEEEQQEEQRQEERQEQKLQQLLEQGRQQLVQQHFKNSQPQSQLQSQPLTLLPLPPPPPPPPQHDHASSSGPTVGVGMLLYNGDKGVDAATPDDGELTMGLLGPEFGDGGETEGSGAAAAAAAPAGPASSSQDRPCGGLSHSGGSLKRRAIFNPGDDDPSAEATTSNPATSTVGERTGRGFVIVRM